MTSLSVFRASTNTKTIFPCIKARKGEWPEGITEKCVFSTSQVRVLEYILSERGVEPDPKKITFISEAHLPQSKKDLRSFLMFCFFKPRILRRFSVTAALFHELRTHKAEFA